MVTGTLFGSILRSNFTTNIEDDLPVDGDERFDFSCLK
jgi:hypothetical protein